MKISKNFGDFVPRDPAFPRVFSGRSAILKIVEELALGTRLDVDKSYSFTNISVRTFSNVKYLTTTKDTTIKQIDNLTETADATSAVQNYGKTVQGTVVALTAANFKTCIFCNLKIQIADDEATTIKCST